MDYNILANVGTILLSNALRKDDSSTSSGTNNISSAINIPGTIVGNLSTVVNTKTYMEHFSRYNNYVTSNLGAAQMAADRYMSLKERVPMSLEYYQTPTEKKEIVMYINPSKLSITTAKVKQKVYTRGGIYFHHYGDDVWTLKLSGTVGYASMKGIEALEEVYHNSGALLKYQNISVSTVHTNQITSLSGSSSAKSASISDSLTGMLNSLKGSKSPISKYLGKVMGATSEWLGYTGDPNRSLGAKIFGTKTANAKSNANLFNAVANAGLNLSGLYNQTAQTASTSTNLTNLMKAAADTTGDATNFKGMFNVVFKELQTGMGTTSSAITSSIAADLVLGLFGGSARNDNLKSIMTQMNGGTGNLLTGVLQMLTGNFTGAKDTAFPMKATSGNYYTLGNMTATELNNVVSTVQAYNAQHTIDHNRAATNWSDIEDQLTDAYRPRQVIIYFDDRIYIGHFDSFSYNKSAETPLIYYEMQFTVTRQVKVDKPDLTSTTATGGGASLRNLFTTVLAGTVMNNLFTPKSDKSTKNTSSSASAASTSASTSTSTSTSSSTNTTPPTRGGSATKTK